MREEYMIERQGKSPKLCDCGCGTPAPIATKTDRRFGWVKGEPMRFVRGHATRKHDHGYDEEDRGFETPCWIFRGGINIRNGYGYIGQKTAHRVYYERENGPIPPGLEPDHLCRVRSCVRPDHIEPVTRSENARRSPTIGRYDRREKGLTRA